MSRVPMRRVEDQGRAAAISSRIGRRPRFGHGLPRPSNEVAVDGRGPHWLDHVFLVRLR